MLTKYITREWNLTPFRNAIFRAIKQLLKHLWPSFCISDFLPSFSSDDSKSYLKTAFHALWSNNLFTTMSYQSTGNLPRARSDAIPLSWELSHFHAVWSGSSLSAHKSIECLIMLLLSLLIGWEILRSTVTEKIPRLCSSFPFLISFSFLSSNLWSLCFVNSNKEFKLNRKFLIFSAFL